MLTIGAIQKSKHFFRRARVDPLLLDESMYPAVWMEVPAAWDEVEPCVLHNSCAPRGRKAIVRSWSLMERVAPFTSDLDVFAPSMVFGWADGLPRVKQTVPRSGIFGGIQALRFCPPRKAPSGSDIKQRVLCLHVVGQMLRPLAPVLGCGGVACSRHSDPRSPEPCQWGICPS